MAARTPQDKPLTTAWRTPARKSRNTVAGAGILFHTFPHVSMLQKTPEKNQTK
jgi:hypothetical protein